MLSRSKKAIFSLVTIVFFLLLLAATEIFLRWQFPSLAYPLITRVQYDGIEWFQTEPDFLFRYFNAGDPLIPDLKSNHFHADKPEGLKRILCLGGSTMFGTPYQFTCNIPGILRRQLRAAYPGVQFEVINFGASAINSNVIRHFAPRLLQFEPDLVLIYMGHNEFYGPDGVSASIVERWFPFLISLKYSFNELRIVTAFRTILHTQRTSNSEETETLMRQVSQGSRVALNSADANWIFERFESNMEAIIGTFASAGVPVLLSDVTSNLQFPPFISDSLTAAEQEVLDRAFGSEDDRAIGEFLNGHPNNAGAAYTAGQYYLVKGMNAQAQTALRSARDNDLLKFRAPGKINEILRSFDGSKSVKFVSADSLFNSLSPQGVPGNDLFWEHLHPTAQGYYDLACLYFSVIQSSNLLGLNSVSPARDLLPFQMDSLAICWLDLAQADYSIRNLIGKWPFQNYRRAPAVLNAADSVMSALAYDTYQGAYRWDEGCYLSASYFIKRGLYGAAQTTYETVLEEYPYNASAHFLLAQLLQLQHNPIAAIQHYDTAIRSNSDLGEAYLDAGLLSVNIGAFGNAERYFIAALKTSDASGSASFRANVLYGLGGVYANRFEFEKALRSLEQALAAEPDHRDAMQLRTQILRFRERKSSAR